MGALLLTVSIQAMPDSLAGYQPMDYKVQVIIKPRIGYLEANAGVRLKKSGDPGPTLSFLLHETFAVESLSLNGLEIPYSSTRIPSDPMRPACQRLDIQIPEVQRNSPRLELYVRYGGALKSLPQWGKQKRGKPSMDDAIGPKRVELAIYSAWYPQWPSARGFSLDLEVILPADWKLVASGNHESSRIQTNSLYSRWVSKSDSDIVVLASPDFRELQVPAGKDFGTVSLFHTGLPQDFIHREALEMVSTLRRFKKWLGLPGRTASTLRHAYSPRELGQGAYSRPGLIVTSEGRIRSALKEKPGLSFQFGNSHELAHFWWNFGRGQGDWINETFAEYFAILSMELAGDPLDTAVRLRKFRSQVMNLPDDAPPMSRVPMDNTGHNWIIRYRQGALMLHRFRERMGDAAFLEACRRFYLEFRDAGAETSDFRRFWSAEDPLDATLVNIWLDNPRGGVSRKNPGDSE